MKKIITLNLFLVFLLTSFSFSQEKVEYFSQQDLNEVCLSQEEIKLYKLVNEYRKQNGLASIALSRALTFVAQEHSKDLALNNPNKNEICNLHSWSLKGEWTECCYTRDHAKANCMWDKPRELTNYTGNGFEISAWSSSNISAHQSLKIWKESSAHNQVMINKGIWENHSWKAIGIGIYNGYANIWFGKKIDVNEEPIMCK